MNIRSSLCSASSVLVLSCCLLAQATSPPTPAPDSANLTGLTTPVEVLFSDGRLVSGSGFFYFVFGPRDPKHPESGWVPITNMYVVTAKHVIQPKRINSVTKFTYFIRTGSGDRADWRPIELTGNELGKRLHLCLKEEVDVAVVDVSDFLKGDLMNLIESKARVIQFSAVHSDEFPGTSPLDVQPGDDVIVIGYPNGFFDQFNKLPILKTGLLNTPVGLRFNGLDAFLLDFKYYEGSSGSIIISKPTHFSASKNGRLQFSNDRRYVFLGVYQGESYWNDAEPKRADLGLGWYYYNVEEAIKNPPLQQ
jgi:hypothetical protein